MSNSTNSSLSSPVLCEPWPDKIRGNLEIPVYYVLGSIWFLMGLTGHSVCLLAFYRQSKKERAYIYQIMLAGAGAGKIVVSTIYILSLTFCFDSMHIISPIPSVRSTYAVMWYSAHLTISALYAFHVCTLFLAMSMSADRLLAVIRPIAYKGMNHRRRQKIVFLSALFLSALANVTDCFTYKVEETHDPSRGTYKVVFDLTLFRSVWGNVGAWLRNTIRMVSVLALLALNYAIVRAFAKHRRDASKLRGQTVAEKEKASMDETLIMLVVFQSVFVSTNAVAGIAVHVASLTVPNFAECYTKFAYLILDIIGMVLETADFYVVVVLSKKIRGMILENVPVLKRLFSVGNSGPA